MAQDNEKTLFSLRILGIIGLIPWFIASMMTAMLFDAPGSQDNLMPWLIALHIWAYPIYFFLFSFLSVRKHKQGDYDKALIYMIVPFAIALGPYIIMSIFYEIF